LSGGSAGLPLSANNPEKKHKASAGPGPTVLIQRLPTSGPQYWTSMNDALQMHRHKLVVDVLNECVGRPTSSAPMKTMSFRYGPSFCKALCRSHRTSRNSRVSKWNGVRFCRSNLSAISSVVFLILHLRGNIEDGFGWSSHRSGEGREMAPETFVLSWQLCEARHHHSALINARRNDTTQVNFVDETIRLPSPHRTGALRSPRTPISSPKKSGQRFLGGSKCHVIQNRGAMILNTSNQKCFDWPLPTSKCQRNAN
jgi:hypothetical protein